jgi:hypothetical protein
MDTQPSQPGSRGTKSGQLADALSKMSHIGTQQERRHQLVHRDAADAATKHMTEDAHLNIVHNTGSSKNKKQLAVDCEYLHTGVNSRQLTV